MTTMPQPRAFSRGLDPIWPACIVVVAVLFNPVLAFINGNIRELTSGPVIAAEMLVMAAAQVWVLQRFDRRMQPWYALMALIGAFTVLRALVTGTFEARYFRDILVLQTFVVLGMTSTERRAIETMLVLQAVVVAGIALEAVSLDTFNALFHVKDYYINTRGLLSVEFTDESSSLYVSATRPEARYFPFFDLHRLSSIFLEPVSLGNFCIITVSFTADRKSVV